MFHVKHDEIVHPAIAAPNRAQQLCRRDRGASATRVNRVEDRSQLLEHRIRHHPDGPQQMIFGEPATAS